MAVSKLQQIQTDFQDYLLGKPGALDAVSGHVTDHRFGMSVSERLAIYQRAFSARMLSSLRTSFQRTRTVAGDAAFEELAVAYINAHPSTHFSLRWFGDTFALFLAEHKAEHPFLSELATLEWALGVALDAPDARSTSLADLVSVPPETWGDLAFGLHPSVQILTLKTNAGALSQAINDEHIPPAGANLAGTQAWLVWRLNYQAYLRSLDELEAWGLQSLAAGATFGAVCAQASNVGAAPCADEAELTRRMAGYLQNWLSQGLLCVFISDQILN